MKNLKDAIYEKLKIDDINLNGNFPIDGKLDDMIEFLENAGFKEVSNQGSWDATLLNYRKYNVKCFAVQKTRPVIIEIIDRSNPKLKDKLFYLWLSSGNKYNIFDDITTAKSGWDARKVTKKEFLKELSEIL